MAYHVPRLMQLPDNVPTLSSLPKGYRPEAPEMAVLRQKILQTILPQTREAPPALPFLKPHSAVRQLLVEPQKMLALMSPRFSAQDLVASGVALRRGDTLILSPVFGTPETSFCFGYHNNVPIDAFSARGVVSGARRELARLARQFGDNGSDAKPILLAVDEEACFFRQLGLHVSSAAPLRPVRVHGVRHLMQVRPLNYRRKWVLVIALWDPVALEREVRPAALKVVEQLAGLARSYDLDVGLLFRAWCPSAVDVARFRHAQKLKDSNLLAKQFRKSLSKSSYTPQVAMTLLRDRALLDFEPARRRVEHIVKQSSTFPLVGEATAALGSLDRAFKHQVVSRFSAKGNSGDRWEALANPIVAQLARDWFEALDLVTAARLISVGKHPESGSARELNLIRRLEVADALGKLHRLIATGG